MSGRRVAVSVDVWNTLLDTSKFFESLAGRLAEVAGLSGDEAVKAVWRAYGRVKRMRARGELDARRVVEQCTRILAEESGTTAESVKRSLARAVAACEPRGLVFGDAPGALEGLRKLGVPVVAVSNVTFWPGYVTRLLLEGAGLGEVLTAQVYADEVGLFKPDPRVFAEAQRALLEGGVKAEIVLHVGDDFVEDFLGAMMAGLVGVLVDRRGDYSEGRYFGGRGYVVRSLSGVMDVLAEL